METNKKQPSEQELKPQGLLEDQLGTGKYDKKPEEAAKGTPGQEQKVPDNAEAAKQDDYDITTEWHDPESQIMG